MSVSMMAIVRLLEKILASKAAMAKVNDEKRSSQKLGMINYFHATKS